MKATLHIGGKDVEVDFDQPIDISIPITSDDKNPIAWYLNKPVIEPVRSGEWIGKVSDGSSTNFNNIAFNPHGHGTHTECVGHITHDFFSINQSLKTFMFIADLISVTPQLQGDDRVITKSQLQSVIGNSSEALIIRTLPNDPKKRNQNYSHTNPPYLEESAAQFIRECGIKHLLIDLPSVDREQDEGKLLAHKAFWNVTDVKNLNRDARRNATITELIFVPSDIPDGKYLLNLQLASFENDASPSKPILYKIHS
ncbi:MAG: cyclase family protein [Flavobacterium sp.]|nr:cyclase family protein [Flavobacterium sp.]